MHKNKSVLITSISKKIPLIAAVRRAVNKLDQFKTIHGCDIDINCIGKYAVDEFWHCPSLNKLKINELLSYCQKHYINAIVPTRNADLEYYASHLDLLKESGIYVMVSPSLTLQQCLDKKLFADIALKYSFPAIETALSINDLNATSFVVKDRFGAGSIQIEIDLTKIEATKFAKSLEHPIFQPYIEGKEWSIDLYRSSTGNIMGCVARERNVVVKGESQITTTALYPSLEKLCSDLADKLNIYGHAVFQVIEDLNKKFHIIECNPRFGGASTASLAVGLDTFYWFLLECLGEDLNKYPFIRSSKEIRQVRYPADWILPWS